MNFCKIETCENRNSHVTVGHVCQICFEPGHGYKECNNIDFKNEIKNKFSNERLPRNLHCNIPGCNKFWLHSKEYHIIIDNIKDSQINIDTNSNNTNDSVNNIDNTFDMNIDSDTDMDELNSIPISNISSSDMSDDSQISSESENSVELELISTSILQYSDTEVDNDAETKNTDSIMTTYNTETKLKLDCPLCRKINTVYFKKHRAYGITCKCLVCLSDNVEIFLPDCGHTILCRKCCINIGKTLQNNINYEEENLNAPSPVMNNNINYINSTENTPTISPTIIHYPYMNAPTSYIQPNNINTPSPTPHPTPSPTFISYPNY